MPKMKTHKGLTKRVRVTRKGKIKFKPSHKGHLMSGKSGSRVRRLRSKDVLASTNLCKHIRRALQA